MFLHSFSTLQSLWCTLPHFKPQPLFLSYYMRIVLDWTTMVPPSIGSYIWIFGPSWWNCLRRIGGYSLIGESILLGTGFEVEKAHVIPTYLFLCVYVSCACTSRCKLLATSLAPCLLACCHASHHVAQNNSIEPWIPN